MSRIYNLLARDKPKEFSSRADRIKNDCRARKMLNDNTRNPSRRGYSLGMPSRTSDLCLLSRNHVVSCTQVNRQTTRPRNSGNAHRPTCCPAVRVRLPRTNTRVLRDGPSAGTRKVRVRRPSTVVRQTPSVHPRRRVVANKTGRAGNRSASCCCRRRLRLCDVRDGR